MVWPPTYAVVSDLSVSIGSGGTSLPPEAAASVASAFWGGLECDCDSPPCEEAGDGGSGVLAGFAGFGFIIIGLQNLWIKKRQLN